MWLPWGCVLLISVLHPVVFVVSGVPLTILFVSFFKRTFRWIRILLDILFKKPNVIYTRGYRFSTREHVNNISKKAFYSKIFFDDKKLKKDYYCFDEAIYRHGELLKISYYPNSRYIEAISRVDNYENDSGLS